MEKNFNVILFSGTGIQLQFCSEIEKGKHSFKKKTSWRAEIGYSNPYKNLDSSTEDTTVNGGKRLLAERLMKTHLMYTFKKNKEKLK